MQTFVLPLHISHSLLQLDGLQQIIFPLSEYNSVYVRNNFKGQIDETLLHKFKGTLMHGGDTSTRGCKISIGCCDILIWEISCSIKVDFSIGSSNFEGFSCKIN